MAHDPSTHCCTIRITAVSFLASRRGLSVRTSKCLGTAVDGGTAVMQMPTNVFNKLQVELSV